jgi:hypothetical protein
MTYAELRAAIQEYAENFEASFVDNVDTFIRLAESRVLLEVRLPRFRKDSSGLIPANVATIQTPSDFLAPDTLSIVDDARSITLLNKDPEFITECYPDTTLRKRPRFYAYVNESTLLLGPTPEKEYVSWLGYFYEPPSIVDSGRTWLGDHFAHALLSGSLVEASQYMKSELLDKYLAAFTRDLAMDSAYAKGRTKKDSYQEPDTRTKA